MNIVTPKKKFVMGRGWAIISILLFAQFIMAIGCKGHNSDGRNLSAKEKIEVIDSVSLLLRENYVFPEMAEKMAGNIKDNLDMGKYQSVVRPEEFAERLTNDLQSISNDKHVSVIFNPQVIRQRRAHLTPADSIKSVNDYVKRIGQDNFGFREVKLFDGNIGYLDLTTFSDIRYARDTVIAKMNFLCKADALIIDLRNNKGGTPPMVRLIASYLFSDKPVLLNSFYWRPSNQTTETWTLPEVPGKRRPDIDVYILTSSETFSAAEEFAYNLKNLKRATLIGETTKGGAHPGGARIASERFLVWIPSGRAINPVTKTNWEGVGVVPDIKTTSEAALDTAINLALKKLKRQAGK